MEFGKFVIFEKRSLIWLFSLGFLLFLGSCDPFNEFSDCPKLIGVAKVGPYRIEKVQNEGENLGRFRFVDSLHGYAFQNFQQIFRTSDGGKTWGPTNFPNLNVFAAHFFSKDSGFVAQRLFDQTTFETKFLIFKTENGGMTVQSVGDTMLGNLNQIHFFDENNGWASGQIELFDSTTMTRRNEYGLYSTKNGGKNWHFHQEVTPGFAQEPMCWVNKSTGFYLSQNGVLYRTTDGGEQWEAKPWEQFLNNFPSLIFVDDNFGYAQNVPQFDFLNQNAAYYFTLDGGTHWQIMASPEKITTVLDFDRNGSGLFVAKSTKCDEPTAAGFFANTQNPGEMEETNPLEHIFQWEQIHFGDPNCFFVAVNGTQLLKVTRD